MVNYIIPFLYTFSSRIIKPYQRVSFIFIYIIPILLVIYSVGSISEVGRVLLAIISVYSIYEIGYLYNDTIAILKEKKPTLRNTEEQTTYIKDRIKLISLFRIILSFLLSLYLNSFSLVLLLVLILILYFIYNTVVNLHFRIFLHFLLCSLRYISPIFIVFDNINYWDILMVVVSFPLPNTIERLSEDKFKLNITKSWVLCNKKSGRYYYYALVLAFIMTANELFIVDFKTLILPCYFFYYRLLSINILSLVSKKS